MSISNFEIKEKLGEGAFSTVFKVVRHSDNQVYALKKVKLISLSQREKENSLNEVRILASYSHPNIIAFKEAFLEESTSTLCIVMELAENGDLLSLIKKHKASGTYFSEDEIWRALGQITLGLKSLHEKNIIHRDLKGANIFIDKQGTMKLGDLNVSKVNKKGMLYTQTGTPYYASPEVWQDKPYDSSSDMWSLGCVIYEMTNLIPPFTANDMRGLYNKIMAGQYPEIHSRYSSDLSFAIKSLILVSPKWRYNCDKILELPQIKKRLNSNVDPLIPQPTDLLGTIRFESALRDIQKKLPAANYENNKINRSGTSHVKIATLIEREDSIILKKINDRSSSSIYDLDVNILSPLTPSEKVHAPIVKGGLPDRPVYNNLNKPIFANPLLRPTQRNENLIEEFKHIPSGVKISQNKNMNAPYYENNYNNHIREKNPFTNNPDIRYPPPQKPGNYSSEGRYSVLQPERSPHKIPEKRYSIPESDRPYSNHQEIKYSVLQAGKPDYYNPQLEKPYNNLDHPQPEKPSYNAPDERYSIAQAEKPPLYKNDPKVNPRPSISRNERPSSKLNNIGAIVLNSPKVLVPKPLSRQ